MKKTWFSHFRTTLQQYDGCILYVEVGCRAGAACNFANYFHKEVTKKSRSFKHQSKKKMWQCKRAVSQVWNHIVEA
jgi:hypothetical protein